jgi:hypothetical protein
MYRNKKAAEVRIETRADAYRASMLAKISELRQQALAGGSIEVTAVRKEVAATRAEMKTTFARMKREEKKEQSRIRSEERAADRDFAEMLRKGESRD